MRVIFFGTPLFAVPTLERLLAHSSFEVLGVVSQPDRPQGRGQKRLPPPVKVVAQQAQLPIWQPERLRRSPETLKALEDSQADAFVVVAYGQILSKQVLPMPRLGCVNVHGSLLPAYRGAAPIQWAIARGESETGITTMLMNEGMDTGDMLLKASVPIAPEQTFTELAEVLAPLGADLLIETLLKLEVGELTPVPQVDEQATYAPLLTKADFHLDWTHPAIELHNQIRAFAPQCFTSFQQDRLKVLRSAPPTETANPADEPGRILDIKKGIGFTVQTGFDPLLITQVQMAGKKVQSAWDFANGVRLQPGNLLGA